MSRFIKYVHVHDDEGRTHRFSPGDEVPAWAEKVVTNPDVIDAAAPAAPVDAPVAADPAPAPKRRTRKPAATEVAD